MVKMQITTERKGIEVVRLNDCGEVFDWLYTNYKPELMVAFKHDTIRLHGNIEPWTSQFNAWEVLEMAGEDAMEKAFKYWLFEYMYVEMEDYIMGEGWKIYPKVLDVRVIE